MGLLVFTVTFASSIFSVNIRVVQEKFHVDLVTATLGVALFVLGFVFGPIAFGPMSEVLGRKVPLFLGFALFAIFQIPVALAQNISTICVGRFLGGFFASAPLAVTGGALADLWDPIPRSYAICVFAAGGFAGPVAGPIAGGFITESHLGWRWTSWVTLIMAAFLGGVGFFVVPETSAARILQVRAARLRKETGNRQYYSMADENKLTLDTVVNVYLLRPFIMFIHEPILALVTAYMSFLYGIVYLLFEAVSIKRYGGNMHADNGNSSLSHSTKSAAGAWKSHNYPSLPSSSVSSWAPASSRSALPPTSRAHTSNTAKASPRKGFHL